MSEVRVQLFGGLTLHGLRHVALRRSSVVEMVECPRRSVYIDKTRVAETNLIFAVPDDNEASEYLGVSPMPSRRPAGHSMSPDAWHSIAVFRLTFQMGDIMANFLGTPGSDNIVGTPGDDWIRGGGGIDFLSGQAGDDIISGTGTLNGGEGDDVIGAYGSYGSSLRGDDGNDILRSHDVRCHRSA